MNIPLDVVHEIFKYLLPVDLLQISRANKDTRATLLNKESVTVWIVARENAGAPPPPPGMPEQAWASLVFESACRICFKNKARDVYWALRVRICFSCTSTSFLRKDPELVDASYPGFDQSAMAAMVCTPTERIAQSEYFFRAEFEAIMLAYDALDSDAAKAQFIVQQKGLKQAIAEHASLVKEWAKVEEENRKQDEEKIRQDRKQDIIERLVRSGYPEARDDVRILQDLEERYPEHFQVPIPLTDGAWSSMVASLLATMAQSRERCLVNRRKGIAIEVLRRWKHFNSRWLNAKGMSAILPEPFDWCNLPPVKRIIEQPAFESDDSIRKAFAELDTMQTLREAVQKWQDNIIICFDDNVIGQFRFFAALNQSPHHRARAPAIESTRPFSFVYKCTTCTPDSDPFHVQTEPSLLAYPEVLQHRCLTRTMFSYGDIDSTDPSVALDPAHNPGLCRTANSHCIAVDYKAQHVFEHLFGLISFRNIPDSRTLDNSPFVFACGHCETSNTKKLYGWRTAIEHALKCDLLPILPDSWTVFNIDHLQLPLAVPVKSKIWLCSICRDLPEELAVPQYPADIQAHLIQAHSIVYPAVNDYYRVCSIVSRTSLIDGVAVNLRGSVSK